MSSANPPTYNFNGLNYNPSFFASTSTSSINNALYVTTTTPQTISGFKTFTTTPVVPTVSTGDNSTNAASTAFVNNSIAANTQWSKTGNDIYYSAGKVGFNNSTPKPLLIACEP